jgi:hypothetical protein
MLTMQTLFAPISFTRSLITSTHPCRGSFDSTYMMLLGMTISESFSCDSEKLTGYDKNQGNTKDDDDK